MGRRVQILVPRYVFSDGIGANYGTEVVVDDAEWGLIVGKTTIFTDLGYEQTATEAAEETTEDVTDSGLIADPTSDVRVALGALYAPLYPHIALDTDGVPYIITGV